MKGHGGGKTASWGLFAFEGADIRAAQAWLDRKGREGWRMTGLFFGMAARFERDTRSFPRYCVRYQPTRRDADTLREYYRRCTGAGWGWAAEARGMDVFVSLPGVFPAPLEAHPELEYRRIGQRARRSRLKLALLAAATVLWAGGAGSGLLLENIRLAMTAAILAMDGLYLVYGMELRRSWRECRRIFRLKGELPAIRSRGARQRCFYLLAAWTLILGLWTLDLAQAWRWAGVERNAPAPLLAEDLGLEGGGSRFSRSGRSLLVDWEQGQELLRAGSAPAGAVTCDVYQCANEPLARLLAGMLRWEEAGGRTRHVMQRHGSLDWARVELGFRQAWIARDGGRACLLVQEGAMTAVVEAPCRLDSAEMAAVLHSRLFPIG